MGESLVRPIPITPALEALFQEDDESCYFRNSVDRASALTEDTFVQQFVLPSDRIMRNFYNARKELQLEIPAVLRNPYDEYSNHVESSSTRWPSDRSSDADISPVRSYDAKFDMQLDGEDANTQPFSPSSLSY